MGAELYRAPRGTTDILPEEQAYWHHVEGQAAHAARLYGYERIDSPAFEDTGLFRHGVGDGTDIVEKEMYTFDDRGGNSITLRPEGTAPVCRAYLEHGMYNRPQPVRLYYITPIFRYDRPQAGRYRQHYQFGCEAFGDADSALDAEVIDLTWQFLLSLGLHRFALQLNSIGCKECRPAYLTNLKTHYSSHVNTLCDDCKSRLEKNPMRLLDCKKPGCQPTADSAPRSTDYLCEKCREHFSVLQHYLERLDIPFRLNHRLVRGLGYYTRTVFEVQPEDEGAQTALAGGGRYDDLIEDLGGKPTPAVGFAAGIERIIINLKQMDVPAPPLPAPRVFLACVGDAARDEATRVAANLRKSGIGIITSGRKSLRAQLRLANNLGTHYAVIIGEDEVKNGRVTLRDMTTAEQRVVSPAELAGLIT